MELVLSFSKLYLFFLLSFRVVREKIILVAAAKNDCK